MRGLGVGVKGHDVICGGGRRRCHDGCCQHVVQQRGQHWRERYRGSRTRAAMRRMHGDRVVVVEVDMEGEVVEVVFGGRCGEERTDGHARVPRAMERHRSMAKQGRIPNAISPCRPLQRRKPSELRIRETPHPSGRSPSASETNRTGAVSTALPDGPGTEVNGEETA
jgi:hypothetical protein